MYIVLLSCLYSDNIFFKIQYTVNILDKNAKMIYDCIYNVSVNL